MAWGEKPRYIIARRNCVCRVCDKYLISKQDPIVVFHSMINRGQNIIICPSCIKDLYFLVKDKKPEVLYKEKEKNE